MAGQSFWIIFIYYLKGLSGKKLSKYTVKPIYPSLHTESYDVKTLSEVTSLGQLYNLIKFLLNLSH